MLYILLKDALTIYGHHQIMFMTDKIRLSNWYDIRFDWPSFVFLIYVEITMHERRNCLAGVILIYLLRNLQRNNSVIESSPYNNLRKLLQHACTKQNYKKLYSIITHYPCGCLLPLWMFEHSGPCALQAVWMLSLPSSHVLK